MNPLETFGEFSRKLTTTDLMLYAGVAVVLWVLFKDKLGGLSQVVGNLINNTKSTIVKPAPEVPNELNKTDLFFELVASWKKTRDLAEKSGCVKAVESVDQLFPHLSPASCKESKEIKDEPTTLRR